MKNHNGQRQFNVNIFYNSSWCMFKTDTNVEDAKNMEDCDMDDDEQGIGGNKLYVPYKFSGKNFTFEKPEIDILDGIRGWAHMYFKENAVFPASMQTSLDQL